MKQTQKWLVGIGAFASLGLAAMAYAAPQTAAKGTGQAQEQHRGMQGHGQHERMASATTEQRGNAQGRHAEKHGTAQGEQHRHEQAQGKGPRGNERRGPQAEQHKH